MSMKCCLIAVLAWMCLVLDQGKAAYRGVMQTVIEQKPTPHARHSRDNFEPDISVFLPVLNEEPNLGPLHEKLKRALTQLGRNHGETRELPWIAAGNSCHATSIIYIGAAQRLPFLSLRVGAMPSPRIVRAQQGARFSSPLL